MPLALVSVGIGGVRVAQLLALEHFIPVFVAVAFAYCRLPRAGPPQQAVLDVPGMNCSLCRITLKEGLERVSGFLDAHVDLHTWRAVVRYDDAKATPESLAKAASEAGYLATVVRK